METPTNQFIARITSSKRVVILGGLAVIAHGLSRTTDDADIWLEPMGDIDEWCRFLETRCKEFGGLTIHRLPRWTPVSGEEIDEAIEETGLVRIMGLDCPLDIFRKPNEFESEEFDAVFGRGVLREDGTKLPHPIDLIVTKSFTNRDKDYSDVSHLESVARQEYLAKLPTATPAEAAFMLDRYSEWRVLQAALENPSPEVKELATSHLREFAAAGDPFSQAILTGRPIPPAP